MAESAPQAATFFPNGTAAGKEFGMLQCGNRLGRMSS